MALSDIFSHPAFIAAAPAIAAGVLTWMAGQYRVKQLESDLKRKSEDADRKAARIAELERPDQDLDNEQALSVKAQSRIRSALNDILDQTGAERGTAYVPVRDSEGRFLGLTVLATVPSNLANKSFLGTVFAGRDARAVRSYLDREPVASSATNFAIDGFRPHGTYSHCLQTAAQDAGAPVGVVQFLSEGGAVDADKTAAAVEARRDVLLDSAAHFVGAGQARLSHLGIVVPEASRRGCALTFDLSRSSTLFTNEARGALTARLMHDIMQSAFKAVSSRNGVFESYSGDGFLAAFASTGEGTLSDPSERAIDAAFALLRRFSETKKTYRVDLGETFDQLQPRVGISTGVVHPISFSFEQMRTSSIIGRTPSLSRLICDEGSRKMPAIVIDEATYLEVAPEIRARFEEIPPAAQSPKTRERRVRVFRYEEAEPS